MAVAINNSWFASFTPSNAAVDLSVGMIGAWHVCAAVKLVYKEGSVSARTVS
jgi:hypothetical protein